MILGAGFIGSECAASLKDKFKNEKEVELVFSDQYPVKRVFGEKIGEYLAKEH